MVKKAGKVPQREGFMLSPASKHVKASSSRYQFLSAHLLQFILAKYQCRKAKKKEKQHSVADINVLPAVTILVVSAVL